MQATNKEALIERARSAGDELVRLKAEQERAWEELIASQTAAVPDRRAFVFLLERYEHASLAVVDALARFRAALRKLGIAGHSAEYLAIAGDVYERIGSRPAIEVLGADQVPGFAFAGAGHP